MEMNTVSVVNHPHPILPAAGREYRRHDWRAGETVRELLIRQGLDQRQEITITLNDRLLTVAEWDLICVQPDDILNVTAQVSGGGGGDGEGGGSNVMQAVLVIVVVVLSIYFGPEFGALLGGVEGTGTAAVGAFGMSAAQWGAIGTAVLAFGGNMIIGAIFSPSGRSLSSANGLDAASQDTPNYSLSGGSNALRPYEPMPIVMGTHRIFPDYGAKPYTEYYGEDQYLYQIFNFGLSSLSITDLKIGETLLSSYQDVSIYWGDANGRISGFPGNVDSDPGAQLFRGADWISRTTSPDTTQIAIDIEGAVYFQGDRGLIGCAATIEAFYAPTGTSAWVPMASRTVVSYSTGYWSLQTTETVILQNEFLSSVTTQTVQHAFESSGHTEGETQLIRAPHAAFDADGLPIIAPALYGTWHWVTFAEAGAQTAIDIYGGTFPRPYPHPDPVPTYSISYSLDIDHGASQKARRNTLRASVTKGQYDVRVRLTSARSSNGEIGEWETRGGYQYSFSVMRSYQEDGANYAGQTRMGLVIKASGQLNGVVQKLSALAVASCTYWDGDAWRWGPTSNPAWWYLDFALGRKNEEGKHLYGCFLPWSQIDVPALIVWSEFCTAEGMSFNGIIDRSQSAWDTLTTIARCGMASISYASGKLGVVWDKKNASPVAAFGMSNIIKGSFSVQYMTENLADEIVVTYVDQDQEWQQKQVRKISPGVTSPTRTSTVELMGCTNVTMAGKFSNYLAAQQFYRKRMISWECDFEGFVCQRGDVVFLSHDLTQWGYSGRIVSIAANKRTLTLERKVPRSGAVEFLMVAFPDGTLSTFEVLAGEGEQDVVTLTSNLVLQDKYGPVDHRWFFSPLPTPGKKVKIVSARPVSQSRIALVATDESPEFYDAWGGTFIAPPPASLLPRNGVKLSNLVLKKHQFVVDGQATNLVIAKWDQSGAIESCVVRAWLGTALIGTWAGIVDRTIDIDLGIQSGTVTVEVTPLSSIGSGTTIRGTLIMSDLPAPLPPVFTAEGALFSTRLSWVFGDTRTDIFAAEIWFSWTNNRAAAYRLTSEIFPNRAYVHPGLMPGSGGYYWMRVVDTRQLPSQWYPSAANAGIYAVATTDATALTTQLFEALGEPQLATGLASRIDLLDTAGPPDMPGGIMARIRAQQGEMRTINDSADLMGQRLLESALKIQENTALLFDAGVNVSPETGEVTIYGVEQAKERLNAAEIRLNAAESSLTLKATSNYVDEQIALAVLDPSQIANLSGVTARLNSAEVGISGLNAAVSSKAEAITVNDQGVRISTAENEIDALQSQITSKVENATFTAVENRVSGAEQQITALEGSGILQTVSDVRSLKKQADVDAETLLRNVLTGKENADQAAQSLALASTELRAYVDDGLSAEAVSRTALATQVAQNAAALALDYATKTSVTEAVTTASQTLTSAFGAADAAVLSAAGQAAAVAIQNYAHAKSQTYTKAEANLAIAENIELLEARLDTGDFAIVKEQASAAVNSVGEIEAKWSVKTQTMADGVRATAGMELMSGEEGQSVFAVLSNKFLFYQPDGEGTPVQVLSMGTVNGENVLGFDGSLTIDGSIAGRSINVDSLVARLAKITTAYIGTANIAEAAVKTANIGDLAVNSIKIAGGSVTTCQTLAHSFPPRGIVGPGSGEPYSVAVSTPDLYAHLDQTPQAVIVFFSLRIVSCTISSLGAYNPGWITAFLTKNGAVIGEPIRATISASAPGGGYFRYQNQGGVVSGFFIDPAPGLNPRYGMYSPDYQSGFGTADNSSSTFEHGMLLTATAKVSVLTTIK